MSKMKNHSGNACNVCGTNTLFYVWTTTRNFPINKYMKELNLTDKGSYIRTRYHGIPVCFSCLNKLKK